MHTIGMRAMTQAWRASVLALTLIWASAPVLADHEPQQYSYAGAASRPSQAQFQPSKHPRPLGRERLGSDGLIAKKLDDLLGGMFTAGLAAIALDQDQIVYEKYLKGPDTNLYPAWSMTKSLVALTMGHALCEGHVKSLDDPAGQYLPEIKDTVWGRATLRQLLQMRSGSPTQDLDRGGDYLYAGTSSGLDMVNGRMTVKEGLLRFDAKSGKAAPGSRYAYSNMDTDTLGLVIAKASGKPFQQYFESTVLEGARLEHVSVFHLDRDGHPVTHAYFFASLRDLARLGRYVVDLYSGQIGNACLKDYATQAVTPYTEATNSINKQPIGYGFQFWLDTGAGSSKREAVRMSGHQGQEVFINLRTGKVVVVLGWRAALRNKSHQPDSVTEWLVR